MKSNARATDPAWGVNSHHHFPQPYIRLQKMEKDLQTHECVSLVQDGELTDAGTARGFRTPEDALASQ